MARLTAEQILYRLRSSDESVDIEAKKASEIGSSIMETVCAFANEPGRGGGYLILGVSLVEGALFPVYEVSGVQDVDKVQSDVSTQCAGMFNAVIRPDISVERVEGQNLILVFVPESQPHEKPVYLKSKGLHKGSFRRIGPTDQHCTDEDIALLYALRDHKTYDETSVAGTSMQDVDVEAIEEYRRARAKLNPTAGELRFDNDELLYALAAKHSREKDSPLTIAGLVLFGSQSALRRHFPMTRVEYIRVNGREWVPDPSERYQAVEMLGPLPLLIPRVVAHVLDDIPSAFALEVDSVHRSDVPLVPRAVIREAVVNALMHRSYRIRGPVQIIRYSNRLELRNPGHSLIPDERLGDPGSVPRNEKIAEVLHEIGLAETKGTGIRTMREEMRRANLTAPLFESDRSKDGFVVTLLVHHLFDRLALDWLTNFKDCNLSDEDARALVVVREVGAISNATYRDMNRVDTLTASGRLRRLRELDLLERKGKGAATYYVPGSRVLASLKSSASQIAAASMPDKGLSGILAGLSVNLLPFEQELRELIETLGERSDTQALRAVIAKLCSRFAFRPQELSQLLGRNQSYLMEGYLRPMTKEGVLEQLYPNNRQHPSQAYRIAGSGAGRPPSK